MGAQDSPSRNHAINHLSGIVSQLEFCQKVTESYSGSLACLGVSVRCYTMSISGAFKSAGLFSFHLQSHHPFCFFHYHSKCSVQRSWTDLKKYFSSILVPFFDPELYFSFRRNCSQFHVRSIHLFIQQIVVSTTCPGQCAVNETGKLPAILSLTFSGSRQ